ncbi:hypothetical protein [Cesiribacter andamanensis]|uniref:Uncharacterized protein n=1 Tax=Cesiribacter andamanensis AMV16 TaxID=1279009 RepID=M7N421_9BACT|nr:hypothetical protein [Cesiribacter andamanensis]EMR01961.1 hypothetical protein ADICEAN_02896 [Cesiribacter andamanensis AMV16]
MTDTTSTTTPTATASPTPTPPCLLAGPSSLQSLAQSVQAQGLDCNYQPLLLEDEAGSTDLTYKRLAPALAEAQAQPYQLFIAAQPHEHKLSAAIRKSADGPFLVLSTHQLSVLLADALTGQEQENSLLVIRSMVLTDMLETLLVKRGFRCKTELLDSDNVQQVLEAATAESGADTVLAITEWGEFYCNKGFAFVVEQLLALQQRLASQQLSLYDQLQGLYYRYGFYREKPWW